MLKNLHSEIKNYEEGCDWRESFDVVQYLYHVKALFLRKGVTMQKRKDHKNRVLRDGESQRKDLSYQYRFTDSMGKRRTVYARTLNELRQKEEQIRKELDF